LWCLGGPESEKEKMGVAFKPAEKADFGRIAEPGMPF